jgi:hypothetical protein
VTAEAASEWTHHAHHEPASYETSLELPQPATIAPELGSRKDTVC